MGPRFILTAVLVATHLTLIIADESNNDWWSLNQRVKETLLENYDRSILPRRTDNGTVRVWIDVAIRGVWLQDTTQVLHVNMWIFMVWHDTRLAWDPKDYGGLEMLHFGEDEIWKPDITVYNNADITEVDHYGKTHAIVYQGSVIWVPPAQVRVECPMDLTYWPYDSQHCHIYLGSWTSHGWQIELNYENFTQKLHNGFNLKGSHHWQVDGGSLHRHDTYYDCCPEPYITMDVELDITRVSPSFISIVILPACVISFLTLLQFVLPLTHPKRVSVGCCALLLTLLELLWLGYTLPPLATSLPIIVKFYGQTLVVVFVSVFVSTGLLRLTDTQQANNYPPPQLLKTLLTGPLAIVLMLSKYTKKVGLSGGGEEDGEVLDEAGPPNYRDEWFLLAAALDRLAACTFLAIFVITLIAFVATL
ncbi:hypothetical protein Pcinc_020997 [Petrolisthes cinctipes]|uniref:Uncharacterized protein n=1 Tax=Petrolisthes cinctipes TaxID=88211 RepID=A0AAE1FJ30_PETCI|nr:hypothetical protein Pcinc_020997 [Petrolisthes cinctipes]